METKYTKYHIEKAAILREISKISIKAYSRSIDVPVGQGLSNLYHDIFSKFYDLIVPVFMTGYYEVIELLVEENVPMGSEVLDLCTGTGNIAFVASKRAKEVIGLDASQRMLSKARGKAEEKGIRNVRFVYGDIREKLDFIDESLDVVTAGFSVPAKIPLFADYNESVIKETCRVLRAGGRLAFFTGSSEISDIYF